jgi:iron complex outermembrane receptor protein
LHEDVDLIVGAKVETNVYTDAEFLPSARLAWRPAPSQMVWAAASRAVRSPARVERDLYLPGKPPYLVVGSGIFDSEVANVYELGYRAEPAPGMTGTITLFSTDYRRLRSVQPQIGGAVFANGYEGTSTGVEAWGTWRVTPVWQLFGGVTATRERWHLTPGSVDIGGLAQLGNDPAVQWNLRSALDITPQLGLDLMARRVSALPNPAVPAYTAVDARLVWRATPKLEVSLNGRNLTDQRHPEWGPAANRVEFERSVTLGFLWTP